MALSNATVAGTLTVAESLTSGMATGTVTGGISLSKALAAGTAAGLADRWFQKNNVALAAGASVTYTLSALTDDLGRTQSMARVRAWGVDNTLAAEGVDLRVASGATNGWFAPFDGAAGKRVVRGGGFFVEYAPGTAGLVVAAGSADQLTITNTGASALTFDIALVGASV